MTPASTIHGASSRDEAILFLNGALFNHKY